MLIRLHNEPVSVTSRLSPAAILARLRQLASERRRAGATPEQRKAGVLAWTLSELPGRISLTPLLASTENLCPPRFVGSVQPLPSGSCVSGEVRVHWFARVFTASLIGAAVLFPPLALFFPGPGVGPHERFSNAARMALIAVVIVAIGLWMLRYGLRSFAAAVRELLAAAASDTGESPPV